MQLGNEDSRRAAIVFAVAGGMYAFALVGIGSTYGGTVSDVKLVIFSTLCSGIGGGLWWNIIVERLSRGSRPRRGAVAGALTAWIAVTFLIPLMALPLGPELGTNTVESLRESLVWFPAASILAVVYFGVFTIPVGTVVGYRLGRRYSPAREEAGKQLRNG